MTTPTPAADAVRLADEIAHTICCPNGCEAQHMLDAGGYTTCQAHTWADEAKAVASLAALRAAAHHPTPSPVGADVREALSRLRNECDLSGLRDKAGFDCWLSLADVALARLAAAPVASPAPDGLREEIARIVARIGGEDPDEPISDTGHTVTDGMLGSDHVRSLLSLFDRHTASLRERIEKAEVASDKFRERWSKRSDDACWNATERYKERERAEQAEAALAASYERIAGLEGALRPLVAACEADYTSETTEVGFTRETDHSPVAWVKSGSVSLTFGMIRRAGAALSNEEHNNAA